MIVQNENFIVITGGPGVGKTTLLMALGKRGYAAVAEDARRIIEEQVQSNGQGLPWKDRELYTLLMFNAGIDSFEGAKKLPSYPVFFDRGIVDAVCYAHMEGLPLPAYMQTMAQKMRYNKNVFILPPWQKIYKTDEARKQTWEEAVRTFAWLKKTYKAYGYDLIEVPFGTVEERVKFVCDFHGLFTPTNTYI